MALGYTLAINSISPTTAQNTGNVGLTINFTLSGTGMSLTGYQISLYSSLTGGTLIKTLVVSDMDDLISGYAKTVTFNGINPGTYYVDLYYKVQGTPRKAITITGSGGSSGINNIKLNGITITSNKINNSNITLENLNGSKVYES